MSNIIISPSKYIQGKGELNNLGIHVNKLGKKSLILVSPSGLKRVENTVKNSFANTDTEIFFETFNGECSKNEINRIIQIFNKHNCDNIIGIGGGKILDTSKAVAYYTKTPISIVPTIASTDAPCSALSVIYSDEGVFEEYLFLPTNPNMVLVDTDIVAAAPARLLVSGIGDALATYFEARACFKSNAQTCAGGSVTLAAMGLAKLCYDTLLADGLKAKLAVENKVCTKAVENIIEANTFLSGIGFESGGLAGAHAIHNGFTVLEECHHLYHGEKVAFGTIVQLVLENSPIDEIEQIILFCKKIGLPVKLSDMGIENPKTEDIMAVAKASTTEGESIHNMPFKVTAEMVYAAILGADALGKSYS
ncbi:hypothetical protein HMPREF1084_00853 [Clostridium butyricum 60E.3]|uniref:glycerol dehydrogenase n=1 Tax=Clostridium butyricum TaxID=1492 RepID=UPI0002D1EC14|nr:glycerol dehydrogenase [Clostridium butyricum]ENZ36269.1 hypothetical protein HMPREF1084_00853 [Clostridium butyricum 60E.3]